MNSTVRGKVYFIGAGPGDPDLITVRGRAIIERAQVCLFAGSLVPRAVVAYAPAGAVVRSSASMDLEQIIALFDEATAQGLDVARVHSGDPSLYGAIGEQMRRLDALGIEYEIIPGVSSLQASAAALRIELMPAGKNQTLILTRAPGRTGREGHEDLGELARHRTGMAFFLSAEQMGEVVQAILPHYGSEAPVAVVHRASWPDEQVLRCTLGEVVEQMAAANMTRTALVLIGPMLEESPGALSRLYDASCSHLFRKAHAQADDEGTHNHGIAE